MVSRATRQRFFAIEGILTFGLCGLLAASASVATTRYAVPVGGASSGSCASWAAACTLQTALGTATSDEEVWVASGVYKPTTTSDRTISFVVKSGVAVYGGFAGVETSRAQRDIMANISVLSGDIDSNDMIGPNGATERAADIRGANSYHVVKMDGTGTPVVDTTVLDGFTITGGSADGRLGGGLYCFARGSGHECSPILTNLIFNGNSGSDGGAIYNSGESSGKSSPSLTNVTFSGNTASSFGGAMYNNGSAGGESSLQISNVTFSDNSAYSGGAIYNSGNLGTSSPSLTNVTFSDNSADLYGGAIYNDGSTDGISNPNFTNTTFSGNSAAYGGAICNSGYFGMSSPVLTNATFSGNSAAYGGAIYSEAASGVSNPSFTNVILWNNTASPGPPASTGPDIFSLFATATIDHSVVSTCPTDGACSHLVTTDPLVGPLQNNGGPTQTMALGTGSSAIDAGANSACPAFDQRGVSRPQDGDGDGSAICDIGAVETRLDVIFADSFETTLK